MSPVWLAIALTHIHHFLQFLAQVISRDSKINTKVCTNSVADWYKLIIKTFIISSKNHVYTMLPWRYNIDVENASFPSFQFRVL